MPHLSSWSHLPEATGMSPGLSGPKSIVLFKTATTENIQSSLAAFFEIPELSPELISSSFVVAGMIIVFSPAALGTDVIFRPLWLELGGLGQAEGVGGSRVGGGE